eukprot:CAMPEP_0114494460 /NCGR_PEP_ID=MMETSP0109-20121206/4665_1 /TAXON_ID=29199 /ORGANISM="Chlorarachnion reptans, Strain CCCM449" /LENGTH=350 /DNA_ID=CAMNT_0001671501 /DNA_START=6 /DNA_END=1058 /DNA_ORIENTATION=+
MELESTGGGWKEIKDAGPSDQDHDILHVLERHIEDAKRAQQPIFVEGKEADPEKAEGTLYRKKTPAGGELYKFTAFQGVMKSFTVVRESAAVLKTSNKTLEKSIEEMNKAYEGEVRDKLAKNAEKTIHAARKSSQTIKETLFGSKSSGGIHKDAEEYTKKRPPGSLQVEIIKNLLAFYTKLYYALHKTYSILANEFRQTVNDRTRRDIQLLTNKNISNEEMDAIIDGGKAAEYTQALIEGEDQAELDRLIARSEVVGQINREVRLLLEMFQDMAALVEQQQETIDNISNHVQNAKEYTGQAATELLEAWKHQLAARKKMLACFVILLIVIAVIVLIALAASGQLDSNNNN